MTRFRLSPEAAQDLIDIYEYIAQDSIEAAERVRTEIYEAIVGLAAKPGKGHRREDLTGRPVLFWPVLSPQLANSGRACCIWDIGRLHFTAIANLAPGQCGSTRTTSPSPTT